jgi:CDP-diacylglycerol--glycerol-3-phosphate 3-phosphatidyltransferase
VHILSSRQAEGLAVETGAAAERVLTVPNLLSFARLGGVPVFIWLVLGPHEDRIAFVLLMFSGFTDYLDGYLARRLHQTSRLGTLLDPLADRLYVASTVVALCIRGITPWWLLGVLAARDIVLAAFLPLLQRAGYGPLPVSYLGKAATLNLLYAFPLLLLIAAHDTLATVARPLGWAFVLWGTVLYVVTGALYVAQATRLLRDVRT